MRELRMLFGREQKVFVLRAACVGGLIVLLAGGGARGVLVAVGITGEVTYVVDRANVLGGQINTGDIFTGWYRYDSSTSDSDPGSTVVGCYEYHNSPFGIFLSIGGFTFASNPQDMDFVIVLCNDDDSKDRYLLSSTGNLPLDGVEVSQILWQLIDDDASVLTSDALIAPVPISGDWDKNNFRIDCSGGATRIGAKITDAQFVPEPTAVLLWGLGAVVLCRRRAGHR